MRKVCTRLRICQCYIISRRKCLKNAFHFVFVSITYVIAKNIRIHIICTYSFSFWKVFWVPREKPYAFIEIDDKKRSEKKREQWQNEMNLNMIVNSCNHMLPATTINDWKLIQVRFSWFRKVKVLNENYFSTKFTREHLQAHKRFAKQPYNLKLGSLHLNYLL